MYVRCDGTTFKWNYTIGKHSKSTGAPILCMKTKFSNLNRFYHAPFLLRRGRNRTQNIYKYIWLLLIKTNLFFLELIVAANERRPAYAYDTNLHSFSCVILVTEPQILCWTLQPSCVTFVTHISTLFNYFFGVQNFVDVLSIWTFNTPMETEK